jgi:hypothetical protein
LAKSSCGWSPDWLHYKIERNTLLAFSSFGDFFSFSTWKIGIQYIQSVLVKNIALIGQVLKGKINLIVHISATGSSK